MCQVEMESHNPNTSLLPAASGPIVAMQGGSYDPTASLLPQASSTAITPMQGGSQESLLPATNGSPIEPMKGGNGNNDNNETNTGNLFSTSSSSDAPTNADIIAAAEAEAARVVSKAEGEALQRVIIAAAEAEAARVVAAAMGAPASSAAPSAPLVPPPAPLVPPPTPSVPPPPPVLPSSDDILAYLGQIARTDVGAVAPFTVTVSAGIPLTGTTVEEPRLHAVVQTRGINFGDITLGTDRTVEKLRVKPT